MTRDTPAARTGAPPALARVSRFACRALCLAGLCAAASVSQAAPDVERLPLPGGFALTLNARELQLVDPRGSVQASRAIRAESLDARLLQGTQGLALLLDSNAERAVVLRFDTGLGTLQPPISLPSAGRTLSAACLYRDAQGLTHAIVVAENGFAQQWLLNEGSEPRSVREFAVAPEASHCRADDGQNRLFISEPGGVWQHAAEPEGSDARKAVVLRRPHGPLSKGGGALTLERNSITVADGKRSRSVRLKRDGGRVLPVVTARVQTAPVAQGGDAADDPAIWVHPRDPAASLVLATDKKRGLAVYDLDGRELQFLTVGRINNVDLRRDVLVDGQRMDIAAATQRDENGIVLFGIDADRRVTELARLPLGLSDIYGLCMRRAPQGAPEVIVNDKDGRVLQVAIGRVGGSWSARTLREFRLASQPEGCVVDDAQGTLYLGEERRGVWALAADPSDAAAADRQLVLAVGGLLQADVEGMALHQGETQAYLVVSSQGNDSYVVLDAKAPYRVRGAFRIGINTEAGVDGASETDGLDVTSAPLGPGFPRGLLVVQDGRKRLPDGPQNFKYVRWDDVAQALALP